MATVLYRNAAIAWESHIKNAAHLLTANRPVLPAAKSWASGENIEQGISRQPSPIQHQG